MFTNPYKCMILLFPTSLNSLLLIQYNVVGKQFVCFVTSVLSEINLSVWFSVDVDSQLVFL